MLLFRDRYHAGLALAERLHAIVSDDPFTLVVGLAKGGVAVGGALAEHLKTDLDVLLVQELELPSRPGFSVGAMVSGGLTLLNEGSCQYFRASEEILDRVTMEASEDLRRQEILYRDGRPSASVRGRTVILADDGSSSTTAIVAAAKSLKAQGIRRLVLAIPMASQQTARELSSAVDEAVCVAMPPNVGSPAMWFESFPSVTDEEIRKVLEQTAYETKAAAAGTY